MYKSIIEKLIEKGIDENDIFLSLERRMHCGVGICQHCAVGPYYVCKNGPVFGLIQLKDIPGAI
jgi:NAD(P)H-flavin reductase